MHWFDGWGMMWMWGFWIVVLVVGIAVVVALARAAGGGGASARDSADETLRQRYARGEIDREEYERKLEDLRR